MRTPGKDLLVQELLEILHERCPDDLVVVGEGERIARVEAITSGVHLITDQDTVPAGDVRELLGELAEVVNMADLKNVVKSFESWHPELT